MTYLAKRTGICVMDAFFKYILPSPFPNFSNNVTVVFMSNILDYGESVLLYCFLQVKLPFLCACSGRLAYYQEAIQEERLFHDMHWPNEEWVKPKLKLENIVMWSRFAMDFGL